MTRFRSLRWKRLAASLLAAAALAPVVHALATDAPKATVAPASQAMAPLKTAARPLLWKVSDQDNSLYLLGSFHLLKADDYPLPGDVDAAFEDAERLVLELAPAEMTDPSIVWKMQALAGYGDGSRLSTVLPPTTREQLARQLGAEKAALLDGFEPWFVNLSLLMGTAQSMGFRPDLGLDLHLMRRAADAGKPADGLETVEEQLRALDSTPLAEQIAGLQELLGSPEEVSRALDASHGAWRDGDADRLHALAVEEMRREAPESYRLINVQRNEAWVPKLRGMLDGDSQDDVLVVVGAMHLLGSDGMVDKLRAHGYAVERICSECAAAE